MSEANKPQVGEVSWFDLTVKDAEEVRDFYSKVAGWKYEPISMGEYSDFAMITEGSKPVGGICHARGVNEGFPAQWLIYITVENLEESIRHCSELGGEVIVAPKAVSNTRFCVIKDPAGAYAGLIEQAK